GIISLNISSLTLTDSGLYRCYVPGLVDSATITLTVVSKDQENRTNLTTIEPEKSGAEKMKVAVIVGGVLTVVALILVLIILRVLVKRRNLWMKKKQEAEKTPNISEMEKLRSCQLTEMKSCRKRFRKLPERGTEREDHGGNSLCFPAYFSALCRSQSLCLKMICRILLLIVLISCVSGAEENKRVGAIVGGVLGVLIGLGLILIGVLVKRRNLRMRWEQEEETTPNNFEMEKLS
ncbi:uncharacterized protein AKAME5_001949800, partial [Lates japonicus]